MPTLHWIEKEKVANHLGDVPFRVVQHQYGFSAEIGYKSNHYPDFIVVTKSGKIILLETKGDDRDNSDSAAKCRLGAKWAELSGKDFYYFMVFDKAQTEGAYTLSKAKELIKQM